MVYNEDDMIPWSYLDNYHKIKDKDLSLLFKRLKEQFEGEINEHFNVTFNPNIPSHYKIGAGNYTYYFLAPNMLNVLMKDFPHMQVSLTLFEYRDFQDFEGLDCGCILGAYYLNSDNELSFFRQIKEHKYNGFIVGDDRSYFCASKKAVEENGGPINALQNLNLLYGRSFKNSFSKEEIPYAYQVKPVERKDDLYKIISDQFYLSYLFMKESIGLWITCDSAPENDEIIKLRPIPGSKLKRAMIFRENEHILARKLKKNIEALMIERSKYNKENGENHENH